MFNPALRLLSKLLTGAAMRQFVRLIKTPGGAIWALALLLLFSGMVVPSAVMAFTNAIDVSPARSLLQTALPTCLFVAAASMCGSDGGKRLLELKPAELQFVLAGPFTNSQILTYRLRTLGIGWLLTAVIFAIVFHPIMGTLAGGIVGIFLSMALVFSLALLRALLGPRLSPRVSDTLRLLVWLCVLAIVVEMAYLSRGSMSMFTLKGIASLVDQSTLARVCGLPFLPAVQLIFKNYSWAMIPNLLLAGGLVASAATACYRFNGGFAELAIEGVARRQKRLELIKGGNLTAGEPRKSEARSWLPTFPWWGGCGPVAWTQTVVMWRMTDRLIPGVFVIGVLATVGVTVAMMVQPELIDTKLRGGAVMGAMAAACYLGVIVNVTTQAGFQMNSRLLTWYQTLPIRPLPMGIGMVAGMAFTIACLRVAVFLPAFAASNQTWGHCLAVLFGGFVFDLAWVSTLNFVSATTSLRFTANGPPDVFQQARSMGFFLAISIALIPLSLVGAMGAGFAGLAAGFSVTACVLGASIAILCILPAVWWFSGYRFLNRELETE